MKVYITYDEYGCVEKVFCTPKQAFDWVMENRKTSLACLFEVTTFESISHQGYCDTFEVEGKK